MAVAIPLGLKDGQTLDSAYKTVFMEETTGVNYHFYVYLQAAGKFDAWLATYNTKTNTEREDQTTFAQNYSDYMLVFDCNVSQINSDSTANANDSRGCCLRDAEQKGGGYCATWNSAGDAVETRYLTDS